MMQFDVENFLDEFESGQPLSINSVAIGSPMAKIAFSKIDSSDPVSNYPKSYSQGKVYRLWDDGTEEELSPSHLYSEVEQYGGWLRSESISWYIEDRVVQRYAIRGEQLSSFNIKSEDQIVELFGQPEHKLMSRSGLEYYYLQSMLVIIWSRRKGELDSIRVGDFTRKEESSKNDLLNGVLYISGVRKIQLSSLEQRYTYEGLLEGSPTSKMNDGIIKHAIETARSYSHFNVHLIEPIRIKLEAERTYPSEFGESEKLPPIRCIGEFRSLHPVKDEDGYGSSLTFIWFQSRLAMPIEECIRSKMELANWDELATDMHY